MHRQRRIAPVVLLLTAVACAGGTERAPATDSVARRPGAGSSTASSSATPAVAPAAPTATDSAVTEHGLGPLRAGMTVAEASKVLGGALVMPAETAAGCDYATWRGGPRGVHVMIDDGLIARVEIDSVGIATAAGARVGDTEERIRSLYPGRVTVTPHKYEDGHYLTVNAVDDSSFAIVFETSKGRVTRYRAGRRPAVEYVEGCS
jgi:hypothetical protein